MLKRVNAVFNYTFDGYFWLCIHLKREKTVNKMSKVGKLYTFLKEKAERFTLKLNESKKNILFFSFEFLLIEQLAFLKFLKGSLNFLQNRNK